MNFIAYPAIDVRDGRVVRLRQGDYAQETRYADDPFAVAAAYARSGARWLHLVDLDGARAGRYTLAPLLARLHDELGLRVQTGGGLRNAHDIECVLEAGAARVVLGSVAVRRPAEAIGWLATFGEEALTIALDTRCDTDGVWRLPVDGWTAASGLGLFALLERYATAGLRHLLCTDIARDGMLAGPNLTLYRELTASVPGVAVQASGGIRHVADVRAARQAGCHGAVLGKALLEGQLDLAAALAC